MGDNDHLALACEQSKNKTFNAAGYPGDTYGVQLVSMTALDPNDQRSDEHHTT